MGFLFIIFVVGIGIPLLIAQSHASQKSRELINYTNWYRFSYFLLSVAFMSLISMWLNDIGASLCTDSFLSCKKDRFMGDGMYCGFFIGNAFVFVVVRHEHKKLKKEIKRIQWQINKRNEQKKDPDYDKSAKKNNGGKPFEWK